MKYKIFAMKVPTHDCDINIEFPGGATMVIQCRPSNADINYNGSLDILLPKPDVVTCWQGHDMEAAPAFKKNMQNTRKNVSQLVMELP